MKLKLSIGQQIAHKKYGAGTVCDVPDGPKSKEIQIRFWIDDGKSEVRWLKNSSRQIRVVRKPQFTVKSKLKKFKSDIVWFIQQILSRKPTKIAKIYDQIITYWTFAAAFKSIQKYMHESSKIRDFGSRNIKVCGIKLKYFSGGNKKMFLITEICVKKSL